MSERGSIRRFSPDVTLRETAPGGMLSAAMSATPLPPSLPSIPASVARDGQSVGLALRYTGRALRLKCPVCGTRPIFEPLRRVRLRRLFHDWLQPLDGCTRCGYPYEREEGYFLFAIFGINFMAAVFVALATYVALDIVEVFGRLGAWTVTLSVALPIPVVNFLAARHSKALWIALDHFFDPHLPRTDDDDGPPWNDEDDDDNNDGNMVRHDPPHGGGGQSRRPEEDEAGRFADDPEPAGRPGKGGALVGAGAGS